MVKDDPPTFEAYWNCELIDDVELAGLPVPPPLDIDLYIGQSRPFSNNNGGRLGGDLHGLYYFPYALSKPQIDSFCLCGIESLQLPDIPSSISITEQTDSSVMITPSGDDDAFSNLTHFLREIEYENTYNPPVLEGIFKQLEFTVNDVNKQPPSRTTSGQIIFVTEDSAIPILDINGLAESGRNYSVTFTEDKEPVSVTPAVVSLERQNEGNVKATISYMLVTIVDADTDNEYLSASEIPYLTVSGSGTSQLVINGPGLPSEFLAVLHTLTYANSNDKPASNSLISFTVYDTEGRKNDPLAYTHVTIVPSNDPPHLALSSANMDSVHTVTFIEKGANVILSPDAVVSDVDSDILTSLEVAITGNFVAGKDQLLFSPSTSPNINYDPQSGVLLVSDLASPAQYQELLRTISFSSTDNPPLDDGGLPVDDLQRTVLITINDEETSSNTVTVLVEFIPTNDPPNISLPGGDSFLLYQDGDLPLPLMPTLVIEDPDNDLIRRVDVSLIFETGGGVLDDQTSKSTFLIYSNIESIDYYTSVLRGITYSNVLDEPTVGNRTVRVEVFDFQTSASLELTVGVDDVNDNSPSFSSPGGYSFSLDENTASGSMVGAISSTDADNPVSLILYALTTTAFSLNPTFAEEGVSIELISEKVFDAEQTSSLEFTITASDGELNSFATVTVTIIDVNEAPSVVLGESAVLAAAGQSRQLLQGEISVTDPDIGDTVTRVELLVENVPEGSQEELVFNETLNSQGYTFDPIESDTLRYELKPNAMPNISIGEALSFIYYQAGEDIESIGQLRTVTITAYDSQDTASIPVKLNISLAGIPIFDKESYAATVTEGKSSADIALVQASGTFSGSVVEYAIEEGYGLEIDTFSGQVTLDEPLDHEITPVLTVKVFAIDTIPPPRTATTTITITVLNVNDESPSAEGLENITASNTPSAIFGGIVITDPDTNPRLISASVSVLGPVMPLPASPLSGKVCIDDPNTINKMVGVCGLDVGSFINILLKADNASIFADSHGNLILNSTNPTVVNASFPDFEGAMDEFTLAFWIRPQSGTSGYVVFFSNNDGTERYLAVYFDASEQQFILTMKQNNVPGLAGQVRVIFQLDSNIADGNFHFVMIQYQDRTLLCVVDGKPVPNTAVSYKNLIGQVFGKPNQKHVPFLSFL